MQIKPKIIIAVLASIIVIIIIASIVEILSKQEKVLVSVSVSPSNARILIDGKEADLGENYLNPGNHTFFAKSSGFESETKNVEIKKDQDNSIIFVLKAGTDTAKEYIQSSTYEQQKREALAGQQANQIGTKTREKNPVIKILPYIASGYRIDYGSSLKNPDDKLAVRIVISAINPENEQKALSLLKSKGYNLEDLEIEYRLLLKPNY